MSPSLEFEDKNVEMAVKKACEELNIPREKLNRVMICSKVPDTTKTMASPLCSKMEIPGTLDRLIFLATPKKCPDSAMA